LTLVVGTGFGIQNGTVSDAAGLPIPKFEGDTTVFGHGAISGCGKTENSGQLDCTQEAQQALAATNGQLPTSSPSGEVSCVMHQINQDGAGPMTAFIDPTGTGQNFQKAEARRPLKKN
jgi:hypothetical protein